MKQREIQAVESFILQFEHMVDELENYSKYLQLNESTEELRSQALEILRKKVKKMKKAKDEGDLKKVLRLGKILKKSGLK
jgi:hypothetical protein